MCKKIIQVYFVFALMFMAMARDASLETSKGTCDNFSFCGRVSKSEILDPEWNQSKQSFLEDRKTFLVFLEKNLMRLPEPETWSSCSQYSGESLCVLIGDQEFDVLTVEAQLARQWRHACGCSECQEIGWCNSSAQDNPLVFGAPLTDFVESNRGGDWVISPYSEIFEIKFNLKGGLKLSVSYSEIFRTYLGYQGNGFSSFATINGERRTDSIQFKTRLSTAKDHPYEESALVA